MRPTSLRALVERARTLGDWEHHLRDFLDGFYAADGDKLRQAASIIDPPGMLEDEAADAFLGGTGEHLARRWDLPIPMWVREDERYLHRAMFVPDEKPLRGYLLGASPVSFRVRLIFTGPEPLQRARFPYHRGIIRLPLDFPERATLGASDSP